MGRAVIHPKSIGLFDTLETFTADDTFTVPDKHGDGSNVEVEMDCFGAGGGSGGDRRSLNETAQPPCSVPVEDRFGSTGGKGGKATSFRPYAPGTVLTIKVGAGGIGGQDGVICPTFLPDDSTDGSNGGVSKVEESGGTIVAQADGGGGGKRAGLGVGADGGGIGDHVFTGGGAEGGASNKTWVDEETNPSGSAGKVEIRY